VNIQLGGQLFAEVAIPVLWGTRAILQDERGRLSIIDLSRELARIEILADKPAPEVPFRPESSGIVVLDGNTELYRYDSRDRSLEPLSLDLPACQITNNMIRVGDSVFEGNQVAGFGVGIAISKDSIALGAPVPPQLAKLRI
jgi:hypothetical protein